MWVLQNTGTKITYVYNEVILKICYFETLIMTYSNGIFKMLLTPPLTSKREMEGKGLLLQ